MSTPSQELAEQFPSNHFLSLPRPDAVFGPPAGTVDTTTLAAHDFDVDTRTGFMPPEPPLSRLPEAWNVWEDALDEAIAKQLRLGDKPGLHEEEQQRAERWRARVTAVNISSM
jgi:indoleamine 2,3-dioxygenase